MTPTPETREDALKIAIRLSEANPQGLALTSSMAIENLLENADRIADFITNGKAD